MAQELLSAEAHG